MRAIWSGSISFGLVNIPIKLFSATSEERLDFDMLHAKDLSPIRFARICKSEEAEVPYEEIVKGFQYEKGHYVVLSKEDFENANLALTKTITILDFVQAIQIDPIYYEKPYYLEPENNASRPFDLLQTALDRSGKVGIGKFVLRNREHLVALRTTIDKRLLLHQLRFASEIRPIEREPRESTQVTEAELNLAINLIDQLSKDFVPENYHDTYRVVLERIIKAKVEGKAPATLGEAPRPTKVPDLMEMLKKSLREERAKQEKSRT